MARPITIIGGGLAGLTLGIGLRRRGIPVTVHEAGGYPRHRVCGEFISGNGQIVLGRLGLLALFEKAGAVRAHTALFVSGGVCSPVRRLREPALCLSRYKMDALLATAFQELGGDLRTASRQPPDIREEGVVAATGRRLQSANDGPRWFGVKAHIADARALRLEADLEMHVSQDGYIGVNQIDEGQINVCGLFRTRADMGRIESKTEWLRGPAGSMLQERLKGAGFDPGSFCSVAGIQLGPQRARDKTECRVGDALTLTPPVTGNGMSMAFESAEMAIEPMANYSHGHLDWMRAQQQIASRCDRAFSGRLAWARFLQWMIVSPFCQRLPAKWLMRSDWLWGLMFARTR